MNVSDELYDYLEHLVVLFMRDKAPHGCVYEFIYSVPKEGWIFCWIYPHEKPSVGLLKIHEERKEVVVMLDKDPITWDLALYFREEGYEIVEKENHY